MLLRNDINRIFEKTKMNLSGGKSIPQRYWRPQPQQRFHFPFPSSFPLPDEFHKHFHALEILWVSTRFRKRHKHRFVFVPNHSHKGNFIFRELVRILFLWEDQFSEKISANAYRYATLSYSTLSISSLKYTFEIRYA